MAPTVENEWKKGSAELLILSLLENQPRHGYDIVTLRKSLPGTLLCRVPTRAGVRSVGRKCRG